MDEEVRIMRENPSEINFEKILIDDNRCEAVDVFDVNNDGILDIVCGEYWYEGPDFRKKHKIGDLPTIHEYVADFSDFGMDVNGDGYLDIVTGFWFAPTLQWKENPGDGGEWKVHDIDAVSNVETVRFFDIDHCGTPEVFPNMPYVAPTYYKLIKDESGKGTGKFKKYVMADIAADHGIGFGDINGDGKAEVVLRDGWLEQPDDLETGKWIFHDDFHIPHRASVPILVYDVNGDGLNDLIVGFAHNYGLVWYEQTLENGNRSWIMHEIDMGCSQYHDMILADIDGDGEPELVTGKRFMAHNGSDPGEYDPIGVYYFKINRGNFEKYVIDFGAPGSASGCGIFFNISDLNGNGRLDIVAPGKDGLYLFRNMGAK